MSSRLINSNIKIPSDFSVLRSDSSLQLTRADGKSLSISVDKSVQFSIEDNTFSITNKESDKNDFKSKAGTVIALLNGAIQDLTSGFKITLKLNGVGFKASVQEDLLILFLGYSHDIVVSIPKSLTVTAVDQINIEISGSSRSEVTKFARFIANLRKRDPYKDKGVHFPGDIMIKKAGKKT